MNPSRELEHRPVHFAGRALLLFVLASLTVFVLEVLERQGVITKLTESTSRLICCGTILGLLVYSARRLSRVVFLVVGLVAVLLGLELCFEVVEDIPAFDAVPLIGHASDWRHVMEKLIVACWTCGGFYLLYVLIQRLDETVVSLRRREAELSDANNELQQTLDELRSTQRQVIQQERLSALGQMASGVAHDLNNALTPVVSLSRALAERKELPEFARDSLELTYAGAKHAAEVVKQLQHFYRPAKDVDHRVIDLRSLTEQAVALTRYRWQGEAQREECQIDVRIELPDPLPVLGDRTELLQLLTNLLLNAIDAIEDAGEIVFSSVVLPEGYFEIRLDDDGRGMTAEQRRRCLEPFFSSKPGGSGLGLSVCHGIARRHQATLELEAREPQGTRVMLRFKLAKGEWAYTDDTDVSGHRSSAENIANDWRGLRVLCIDDHASVRKALHVLFEPTGIALETASSGAEGLARLAAAPFDLVLTDLGMHEMSGREVVQRIKRAHEKLPVAVVSGWSQEDVIAQFEQDAFLPDFVIEKPITLRTLRHCLDATAAHRNAPSAAVPADLS